MPTFHAGPGLFPLPLPDFPIPSPLMDAMPAQLVDGLIVYLCFIPILTFHEFAHAWVASKCGDDTARDQGRVSLNPAVHIDPLGTIFLPLLALFLGAADSKLAGFIIGWGKPVPVNLSNLRHPRRDDTLVALAGPFMNVLLAFGILVLVRILAAAMGSLGDGGHWKVLFEMAGRLSVVSLFLCFFNLLPIPPLDGSHVLKNFIGLRDETYWRLCQYGFIAVIIALQFQFIQDLLSVATHGTLLLMVRLLGL